MKGPIKRLGVAIASKTAKGAGAAAKGSAKGLWRLTRGTLSRAAAGLGAMTERAVSAAEDRVTELDDETSGDDTPMTRSLQDTRDLLDELDRDLVTMAKLEPLDEEAPSKEPEVHHEVSEEVEREADRFKDWSRDAAAEAHRLASGDTDSGPRTMEPRIDEEDVG